MRKIIYSYYLIQSPGGILSSNYSFFSTLIYSKGLYLLILQPKLENTISTPKKDKYILYTPPYPTMQKLRLTLNVHTINISGQ